VWVGGTAPSTRVARIGRPGPPAAATDRSTPGRAASSPEQSSRRLSASSERLRSQRMWTIRSSTRFRPTRRKRPETAKGIAREKRLRDDQAMVDRVLLGGSAQSGSARRSRSSGWWSIGQCASHGRPGATPLLEEPTFQQEPCNPSSGSTLAVPTLSGILTFSPGSARNGTPGRV